MRQLLSATAWMFTAVFGAFCLAMLFFGDWVAMLTYGPSFAGTGFIVAALAANVLVGSLGFVAQTGLLAIGQPRMSLIADVCMLATTMASAMLLVLPYGALGAALATLIGVVIGTAIKGGTLLWLMRSLERSGDMIPASADEGPATETLFAHIVPAKT
jgi:O-antigen/teichoic acid export membrane protein